MFARTALPSRLLLSRGAGIAPASVRFYSQSQTLRASAHEATEPEPKRITFTFADLKGNRYVIENAKCGTNLLEVARQAKVPMPGACNGGMGNVWLYGEGPFCGQCFVFLPPAMLKLAHEASPISPKEISLAIHNDQRNYHMRLACQVELVPEMDGMQVALPDYPEWMLEAPEMRIFGTPDRPKLEMDVATGNLEELLKTPDVVIVKEEEQTVPEDKWAALLMDRSRRRFAIEERMRLESLAHRRRISRFWRSLVNNVLPASMKFDMPPEIEVPDEPVPEDKFVFADPDEMHLYEMEKIRSVLYEGYIDRTQTEAFKQHPSLIGRKVVMNTKAMSMVS